jgi:two-component system phosphate regulon sensor histidine kinase PhoR
MIDRLLESASFESESDLLVKTNIDLVKLIKDIQKEFPFSHGTKEIEFHTYEAVVKVHADLFHLKRALINILDNAVKYGGENIKIILETSKDTARLTISDNGTGVSKEEIPKIFE